METVQVALLLRDSYKNRFPGSRTTTLTANGHVTFAFGSNNDSVLQFTLDQWKEIVQFVFNQIAPVEMEEKQKSWVDWSKVDEKFNFVAIDADYEVWAFIVEPVKTARSFDIRSFREKAEKLFDQSVPDDLDWTQSLVKRPISYPNHVGCKCG